MRARTKRSGRWLAARLGGVDRYWSIRHVPVRARAWAAYRANRSHYRFVDEVELSCTRRSDTVFVFGSGASLNDLTPEEIAHIEEHDTLGFNWFVRQRFVRCDYHLIRGIPDTDLDPRIWRPQLDEYFDLVRSNPRFADTVFLVQAGFRATNGNRAIGHRLLPESNPLFLWRTNVERREPGRSFAEGLTHGRSTLQEAVNFAFVLGWKRIVLVGVDLYDRRYFWLPPDEARSVDSKRDADVEDLHSASGLVAELGHWRASMAEREVVLSVYNPRSLLASVLPTYER